MQKDRDKNVETRVIPLRYRKPEKNETRRNKGVENTRQTRGAISLKYASVLFSPYEYPARRQ